jgi:hypothetical protein
MEIEGAGNRPHIPVVSADPDLKEETPAVALQKLQLLHQRQEQLRVM